VELDSALRVWVPGCATGEEAYSLAMLMKETIEKLKRQTKIQIFATDIDEEAIKFARAAIYPDSIAADISEARLKRFFFKEKNAFKVKEQIREMVVFANHNLIKDPPFSKLHMISCRNLMIYMGQVLQKKIIPLFHYALNQDGILFLGTSESIGEFSDLFHPVDKKWKIYKRKGILIEGINQYHRDPFNIRPVEVHRADRQKIPYDFDIHNNVITPFVEYLKHADIDSVLVFIQ